MFRDQAFRLWAANAIQGCLVWHTHNLADLEAVHVFTIKRLLVCLVERSEHLFNTYIVRFHLSGNGIKGIATLGGQRIFCVCFFGKLRFRFSFSRRFCSGWSGWRRLLGLWHNSVARFGHYCCWRRTRRRRCLTIDWQTGRLGYIIRVKPRRIQQQGIFFDQSASRPIDLDQHIQEGFGNRLGAGQLEDGLTFDVIANFNFNKWVRRRLFQHLVLIDLLARQCCLDAIEFAWRDRQQLNFRIERFPQF